MLGYMVLFWTDFWHHILLLSGVELLGDDSTRLVLHVAARVAELPVGQSTYDFHRAGGAQIVDYKGSHLVGQ